MPSLADHSPSCMCPPATSVGILRVLRDHRAGERQRVLERPAHHVRVGHAVAVVGEDAHAEVVQLPERRKLAGPPDPG